MAVILLFLRPEILKDERFAEFAPWDFCEEDFIELDGQHYLVLPLDFDPHSGRILWGDWAGLKEEIERYKVAEYEVVV